MTTAQQAAEWVVEALINTGTDYSPGIPEIARLFDQDLWQGNWDSSTDFDPALGLKDLRFIQEDEYDQHMDDEEDAPDFGEQLTFTQGHYIFYA